MPIDFGKLTDKIVKRVLDNLEGSNSEIKDAGEQVSETFVDGVEQGLDDAARRIEASSVKITKAFRDLAKKITNQKDIFNVSLGGKNITVDIDFSDINIDSDEIQKKINETFEKIKIGSGIEFDSKTAEKHFKDMLGLRIKYAAKLERLQNSSRQIKTPHARGVNAQEQLAVMAAIGDIEDSLRSVMSKGGSIHLPSVYFESVEVLRDRADLVELNTKREEVAAKKADTAQKTYAKKNKELERENELLKERNKLLGGDGTVSDMESTSKPKSSNKRKETTEVIAQENQEIEEQNRILEKNAKLSKNAYETPAREKPSEMGKWKKAKFYRYIKGPDGYEQSITDGRTDGNYYYHRNEATKHWTITDPVTGLAIKDGYSSYKNAQEDVYGDEMQERLSKATYDHRQYQQAIEAMREAQAKFNDTKAQEPASSDTEKQRRLAEEAAELVRRQAEEDAFNAELEEAVAAEMEAKLNTEKEVVQLTDNYGKSLDEVNNKLMQGVKLLNEQGQIIRLFHNSSEIFDEFDPAKAGSNQGQALGLGNYLALHQNGEFNDPVYGRYQTQWYANVQNPYKIREDKLTSEQASSVIDKFLADRAKGFKNHMLSKLLDGDVVEAMKDIAHESGVAVGDVFGHIGYDAIMDGAQINVFDSSKIHRANDAVLDIGADEFAKFRELREEAYQIRFEMSNAERQLRDLENEYTGQSIDSLSSDISMEEMIQGYGWRSNVTKMAHAYKEQTGKLPELESVSQESLGKMVENYEFSRQAIPEIQKSIAERQVKLNVLDQQIAAQKVIVDNLTREYLDGESHLAPEKVRKHKFTSSINDKTGKFRMRKTESSNLEAAENITPKSVEDGAPQTQAESQAFDKVGEAADKAAGKKKKFAKANKEVAASVGPSVSELETEADAIENVGEAAAKTNRTISEEARRSAESMSFSTRDYERLYDEMEAFAEQRKAENGYDLSRVTVNTDANGNPLGATIAYYKKATKETITETFKIDKAAQEAEDGVNRLVLSSRKATAGIADFEKATLQAINRQDQLIAQKNKTVSSLSAVLDPNSNRSLAGTDYEEETRNKIQAIKDEVAKLDRVDSAGERIILSEKDFLVIKRRIAELTQDARDFINSSKNAEYAPTQLESHSVSSGNKYRKDQLNAYINEWKSAGIYAGDLKTKVEELSQSVDNITKHEDLKKYLEGMKEARALAKLAAQDKKAEADRQKNLNSEYKEYMKLIRERNAIEKRMIGIDDEELLAPLRELYDKKDNEINSKYGSFLSREDVQKHFNLQDFTDPQDEAELEMEFARRKATKKKKLEEEAAAQKVVNEAYAEYKRLMNERSSKQMELVGLDPTKNKEQIATVTAQIDEIDAKLNATYGDLLANKVAQATLTLEDFLKYYDKWQHKIADKEAKAADKARNKEEAPYRNYGKTTANAIKRKQGDLQGSINTLGVTDKKTLGQIDDYNAKVKKVLDLREQFANNPKAAKDDETVKKFQKASYEAEQLRRNIKAIIDEEHKMAQMAEEQGFDPMPLSPEQMLNRKYIMEQYARATSNGRVEIKGWNADNTKLYYTVTDSKGAVQEMTKAIGQGTNTMYTYRTATKETGTLMEQIFKSVKVKAKELVSYVIGGGSVYKVIAMLRQGIQYIREIDIALTELKKVTDETEETYDKFLKTAAKTAEKVGSTIKDVVSSTADWARLGYSLKEATQFAETTQILMNVSEFTDVSQATDTLISAVQAFGYTADTSMDVVDLLNTIGK